MNAAIKISWLIPAFNEAQLLPRTLDALNSLIREIELSEGVTGEIIVCDNNSTDRTAAIARNKGARVVFEPVNQIARARNTAAAAAQHEWLVFLDADTWPSRGLILETIRRMKSGLWLGGGTEVKLDESQWEANFFVALWNFISRTTRLVAGSYLFIERKTFIEIGGFSEQIFAGEELEFSKRAKRLAKNRDLKWNIITGHPIISSARKLHLYSLGERISQMARILFLSGGLGRSKESCNMWYDGRR